MVATFSKPQAAREIEARARARKLHVRVEVIEAGKHYQTRSKSQPGAVYDLRKTGRGWTCSCDGFHFTGVCKHVAAVERRSEREGWKFGQIAPRATSREDRQPVDDYNPGWTEADEYDLYLPN